jgi:hypothetical protein
LTAGLTCILIALPATAGRDERDSPERDDVKVEVSGWLHDDRPVSPQMTVEARGIRFHLDFGKNEELLNLARKMYKEGPRLAVVTGTLSQQDGRRGREFWIGVRGLRDAEAKPQQK